MTDNTLLIAGRFNGPPNSGNGGYCCGLLANYLGGSATVRLSNPPPLDTPLTVNRQDDATVELQWQDKLVAMASTANLDMDVPAAPTLAQAALASKRYAGFRQHTLPLCYVCGPERPQNDGMHLFAGPVPDTDIHACVWSPHLDQLCNQGSAVRPEIVWAALDCPGYFALYGQIPKPALLGELTATLEAPVDGGQDHVVFAWPISRDGRKLVAGTAIADRTGRILARARATWIELKA